MKDIKFDANVKWEEMDRKLNDFLTFSQDIVDKVSKKVDGMSTDEYIFSVCDTKIASSKEIID